MLQFPVQGVHSLPKHAEVDRFAPRALKVSTKKMNTSHNVLSARKIQARLKVAACFLPTALV